MNFDKECFKREISQIEKADVENRKFYKETFDEVHASGELLGKVLDMKKNQKNRVFGSVAKLGYIVAAGLVIGMVSTNIISYAQTGNTWIGRMFVMINGVEQEVEPVWSVDEDGNEQFEISLDTEEGDNVSVGVYEEAGSREGAEASDQESDTENRSDKNVSFQTTELKEVNGRIYLLIGEDIAKIDVTEDIKDGKCEGTFEQDGETWNYELTGDLDEYSVNISKESQ